MKQFFDQNIINKAVMHARSKLPEESCGFITDDDYIPMVNVCRDRKNHFKIDPKQYIIYNEKIRAIIHSHNDYPHASMDDMLKQVETAVPWGIMNFRNGFLESVFFWGDQLPIQDLIGRPFVHGVYDCYGLVRDYYRTKGHTLPLYPREHQWWTKQSSMLLENVEKIGCFDRIDPSEIKEGDMFFMNILSDVVNHSGIYLGDEIILHHLQNRLSRKELIHRWKDSIYGFYRLDTRRLKNA
jgi:cell wall-associated NlpC family hydrolase